MAWLSWVYASDHLLPVQNHFSLWLSSIRLSIHYSINDLPLLQLQIFLGTGMVWDTTGGSFSVNLRSYHDSLGILHAHTFAAFDTSKGPWGTQTTTDHCYLASAAPFFHILDKGRLQLSSYLVGFVTKNWAVSKVMGISQASSSLPFDLADSVQIRLTDAKFPPSILSASLCACLQRIQPCFSLSHLTPLTSASCMESDSTFNPEIWVATTLLSLGTVAETIHLLTTWVM
ncbi:hypothetical protein BELL_0010g00280 [Botrytis elliptica]|uniref:Uncharacterized protein n=1 Tax=Botrytis elliptica TaxID=278938 RepID=A0A4Z1K3H3_9HELO|nr:hypothetical protein BELL_0010g00280 [Botrytis elliptica]